MSDDEADEELLALLRASLGIGPKNAQAPADTKVLRDAEYIYDNAIDVFISSTGTKSAASTIWALMQEKEYSPKIWCAHELHPKEKNEATLKFIFTIDLLNFSFWPENPCEEPFTVDCRGKSWTGYWSLVAALQRALDEGIRLPSMTSAIADYLVHFKIYQSPIHTFGTMKTNAPMKSWSTSSGHPLGHLCLYLRREYHVCAELHKYYTT